jgi:putative transposase
MKKKRRKSYTAAFKVKIALEAIKGQRTINEIATHYGVHPNMAPQWKKRAIESLPDVFSTRRERDAQGEEALKAELYRQIGQLKVELDRLKKKLVRSTDQKRQLVEPDNDSISVCRQCELIGLPRASFYYEPGGESAENLRLMRLLDEQYTRTPFYGVLKMTAWLRENCHPVNCKRVRRLLRLMGLEAIYPKKTSTSRITSS